jgi:hypothetical protein
MTYNFSICAYELFLKLGQPRAVTYHIIGDVSFQITDVRYPALEEGMKDNFLTPSQYARSANTSRTSGLTSGFMVFEYLSHKYRIDRPTLSKYSAITPVNTSSADFEAPLEG